MVEIFFLSYSKYEEFSSPKKLWTQYNQNIFQQYTCVLLIMSIGYFSKIHQNLCGGFKC